MKTVGISWDEIRKLYFHLQETSRYIDKTCPDEEIIDSDLQYEADRIVEGLVKAIIERDKDLCALSDKFHDLRNKVYGVRDYKEYDWFFPPYVSNLLRFMVWAEEEGALSKDGYKTENDYYNAELLELESKFNLTRNDVASSTPVTG